MPKSKATPIACTLTPEDFDSRLAWIAELTRDALREYRRRDLVLELTYAPEAAHRVREMVRRERACCAFLAFDLREEPDAVRLILTAPEDARAAADTLFEQFEHSKQWPTRAKACTGFPVSDRPKGPQPLDDVDRGFGLLPWPGIGATP